jgi:hypothetical protein
VATYYQPSGISLQLIQGSYPTQHTVYRYAGGSFNVTISCSSSSNFWSETGGAPTTSPSSGASGTTAVVTSSGTYSVFERVGASNGPPVSPLTSRRFIVADLADPTIGSQSFNTSTQSNQFVHTIGNVSGGTSGAPVQYGYSVSSARNTNNPSSTPTWLSGNTLTVVRGYYYRFFVRVSSPSGGNASSSQQVPYIPNNTGASFSSGSSDFIASGAASFNLSVSNCAQYHAYRLGTNTSFGSISPIPSVYTGSGSGTFNISVTNSMNNYPPSGGQSTYYLYASRSSSFGGPGDVGFNSAGWTYIDSITVYSVIPPTVNNSQSFNTTTTSNIISHTVSLSNSGSNGTLFYALSKGSARDTNNPNPFSPGTSYQTNATFFNIERGYYYYFYAYRSGNGIVDRNNTALQVPYLSTNQDIGTFIFNNLQLRTGLIFDYILGANDTSTSPTFQVTNTLTSQEYSVFNDDISTNLELSLGTGNGGTLTGSIANSQVTSTDRRYYLATRRTVANGGDGVWRGCIQTGNNNYGSTVTHIREVLGTATANSVEVRALNSLKNKLVPIVNLTTTGTSGNVQYAFSTTDSTPSNWTNIGYTTINQPSWIADASRLRGSLVNAYFGVRLSSQFTGGGTTTPSYASLTGITQFEAAANSGGDISLTYDGDVYFPEDGDTIDIPEIDTTNDVTVSVGSAESVTFNTISVESTNSVAQNSSVVFSTATMYVSYKLRTDSANSNVGAANTEVGSYTNNSSSNLNFTISNPSEIPAAGTNLGYTAYNYLFAARGGDGVERSTAWTAAANSISISRGITVDISATATPAKTTLTATGDTTLNVTIAGGSSPTEYRLRNTTASQNIADTQVSNGTITIQNSELPSQNSSATYKLQARVPISSGGFTNSYQDTSPLSTFILNRLQGADGAVSITVPNTTLAGSNTSTQTISLAGGNNNTQYRIRVTASTGGPSVNAVVGESIPTVDTTSFSLITSELPTAGNSVDYIVEYREVGTSTYLAASGTNTTFTINRSSNADGSVSIDPGTTQFYNNPGTFSTVNLSQGNSSTEYRLIVTASTTNLPSVGTVVDTDTPTGNTASFSINPSTEKPPIGERVTYQVQFRESGSGSAFSNCTGTNTTFTMATLNADALALTDGVSPNNRSTSTPYDSTSKTANGIATTQTFSISGTGAAFSVNGGTMDTNNKSVSEGDSIIVRLTTASTYSTSRTATLGFPGLTPNTKTWTLTTGVDGGSGNDGGDTGAGGTYGLEIYNSSGNSLVDGTSRVSRLVSSGVVLNLNGGGTTSSAISVTGLTTSDDWSIVVTVGNANVASAGQIDQFSVNRSSGSFTITNNTQEQESGSNDNRRRFYWRVYKTG